MKYRKFTLDLKRSLVEQLLSETATPTELTRRHNLSSGQLYTWKKQYAQCKLDPKPSREAELAARVREPKRMLGKVILENEFPKKSCTQQPKTIRDKRKFIAASCRVSDLIRRVWVV